MKKILFAVVGIFLLNISAFGQRPDLPGALIVDIGLNNWGTAPTNIDLNSFQSKTVNITYFYDIALGSRGWTFTPGIGLGLEKYSLNNNYTFTTDIDNQANRSVAAERLPDILDDALAFGKSKLGLNYLDIPLELRYYTSKNQYNRGFRVAVGPKFGVLYSSFTKFRYEDTAGDKRLVKDRSDFGFNRFRYGVQARIGFGGFSFFGFYELSDKWDVAPAGGTDTRTLTLGISLTGF